MQGTDQQGVLAKAIERSRRDPEFFFRHILKCNPWPVQIAIAESVRDNKRTAVPSCHGSGKSWIAARTALWFLYCHPQSVVVTTAPSNRQVENILWKEIGTAMRSAIPVLGGRLYRIPRLEIEPDWFAYGFSTDDPNNFQGTHAKHVLIEFDEASGVKPPIWEALEGNLSSEHVRFLAIANPTDSLSLFFHECQDPKTNVIKISAYDTPNFTAFDITEQDVIDETWQEKITGPLPHVALVTPEYAANALRKYGRNSLFYLPRVLGEFPQQSTDALLWMSWLNDAQANHCGADDDGHPTLVDLPVDVIDVGVDVAGGEGGGDETVIAAFSHQSEQMPQQLLDPSRYASSVEETTVTCGKVLQLCVELRNRYSIRDKSDNITHSPRILLKVDADGIGLALVQSLREKIREAKERFGFIELIPVHSGAAARNTETYGNARAEHWFGIKERLEDRRLGLWLEAEQAAQLGSLKYKYRSSGQALIESKQDAARRGISSPDRADAVMIALAQVKPSHLFRPQDIEAVASEVEEAEWLWK